MGSSVTHRLSPAGACRKNFAFGNQNIFKDRKNSSWGSIAPSCITAALQVLKTLPAAACSQSIIFLSMWMSKSGLALPLRAEQTTSPPEDFLPSIARDGGPDRTRTYDPRLIKAVL